MNRRSLCAALCISLCIAFTACNQENMSKVTINFGEIPLAKAAEKPGILDRIADVLLPRACASWTPDYGYILLAVTGPDMDAVTALVPPGSYKYTIEIPNGVARLFTLFAYEGGVKKWGGHVLANVEEDEVDLFMNVFPVVTNLSVTPMFVAVGFDLEWDSVPTAAGYNIYRSANLDGPFQLIAYRTVASYADTINGTYHYRVSVVYPRGEGEPCDAK